MSNTCRQVVFSRPVALLVFLLMNPESLSANIAMWQKHLALPETTGNRHLSLPPHYSYPSAPRVNSENPYPLSTERLKLVKLCPAAFSAKKQFAFQIDFRDSYEEG
jgi:hypothetical protein